MVVVVEVVVVVIFIVVVVIVVVAIDASTALISLVIQLGRYVITAVCIDVATFCT